MKQYSNSEIMKLGSLIRQELGHCLWGQEHDGVMKGWEFPIRIKVASPYKEGSKVYSDIEYEFLDKKLHFTSQWVEPWDGFKAANPEWKPNFAVNTVAIDMAKSICKTIEQETNQK